VPDNPAAACDYLRRWSAVKLRWGLSVDSAELAALTETAAGCEDVIITVELAR